MAEAIDWYALDGLQVEAELIHAQHNLNLSDVYVRGEGDNPQVFIFCGAPSAQDEIQQRPFVDPAGRVLRDLMALADLASANGWVGNRELKPNCWLTNVVKFRPPRNRDPYWVEVALYRPLLRREWIAVGSPMIIVPVGSTALTAVYGIHRKVWITDVAGKRFSLLTRNDTPYHLCPMLHPSFGLRNPELQPLMERHWADFGNWLWNDGARH